MHRLSPIAAIAFVLVAVGSSAGGASAAPAGGQRSYATLRFEEDWSWILDQDAPVEDVFDAVKHRPLGGDWHLTFGGSARVRAEGDTNRTLGAGTVDDEELVRVRSFLHLDISHRKDFRWFAEIRWSDTLSEERPVAAIFRDDIDFQNFFFEGTIASDTPHPVTIRAGRQELLFGRERLVSPLDWSNTRRTFDGLSITAKSPRTKTVVFAMRPVMHEIHDIDSPDEDVLFGGVITTIKPAAAHLVEGWWYLLDDSREIFTSEVSGLLDDARTHTFGLRYEYSKDGWLAETLWAFQQGDVARDDVSALWASATGAYQWNAAPWKPRLLAGLDLATGDDDPTDGDRGTFNQLFPLGHAWLGHIDLVGRQNIRAARLEFSVAPAKGLKWVTALHSFALDERRDALYNAGGSVVRKDPTGAAGRDVGLELDSLVSYSFARHHQVAFEVSRWWSGDFIEATGSGRNATWWWVGYEFKF